MYKLERQFVTTAHQEIRVLENIWSGEIAQDYARDTKRALQTIKRAALQVQARAVFRSAGLCEDICIRLGEGGGSRLSRNLSSLKALIGQYANGLFEIDPEFEAQWNRKTDHRAPVLGDIAKERKEEHAAAVQTLTPLLEFVKQDGRTAALSSLMNVQNLVQEDVISSQKTMQSLDAIMRPITNLVLSEARQSGKTVSVSYGADFESLEETLAIKIQRFLQLLCLNIVTNSVDEDAAAQISVTGQKRDLKTEFTVSWSGKALQVDASSNSHFSKAVAALQMRGGSAEFKQGLLQQDTSNGCSVQNAIIKFPNKNQKTNQAVLPSNIAGGKYG